MFKVFKNKIIFTYLLFVIVLSSVFFILTYNIFKSEVTENIKRELLSTTRYTKDILKTEDINDLRKLDEISKLVKDIFNLRITFIDSSGNVLADSDVKLDDIKKQVEKKNQEIKEIVFQLQKSKNLNEQKKEAQTAIENSNHQLQIFKDKGVEEKLKKQTFYETDVAKLNNYKDEIKIFIDSLSEILRENSSIFESYPDLSELNKKYIDELKEIVQNLKNEKNNIEKALQQIMIFYNTLNNMVNSIEKDKEYLKEEFAKIKREGI